MLRSLPFSFVSWVPPVCYISKRERNSHTLFTTHLSTMAVLQVLPWFPPFCDPHRYNSESMYSNKTDQTVPLHTCKIHCREVVENCKFSLQRRSSSLQLIWDALIVEVTKNSWANSKHVCWLVTTLERIKLLIPGNIKTSYYVDRGYITGIFD